MQRLRRCHQTRRWQHHSGSKQQLLRKWQVLRREKSVKAWSSNWWCSTRARFRSGRKQMLWVVPLIVRIRILMQNWLSKWSTKVPKFHLGLTITKNQSRQRKPALRPQPRSCLSLLIRNRTLLQLPIRLQTATSLTLQSRPNSRQTHRQSTRKITRTAKPLLGLKTNRSLT